MRKLILLMALFSLGLAKSAIANLSGAQQEQKILSATIMITITTPNWGETNPTETEALPIPNDEYRAVAHANGYKEADGLGTIIEHAGETFLVTHDHWSNFEEALGTVTLRTAGGSWLAAIDLRDFKEHVRYRDGSLLILALPADLQMAVAGKAQTATADTLQSGDQAFLALRANGRVDVISVNIITQAEKEGRPVLHLQSTRGQTVTGGDSGGGLWNGSHLVGVTWTTIMMENQSSGVRRSTDQSVAAVYQGYPSLWQ
jgi:hypothetical protein